MVLKAGQRRKYDVMKRCRRCRREYPALDDYTVNGQSGFCPSCGQKLVRGQAQQEKKDDDAD